MYVSLATNGIVDGVNATDDDILYFDGTNWTLFFDGTDADINGDVNAFHVIDENNVLLSFSKENVLNGVTFDDRDIALFTGTLGEDTVGTFSLYFDGDANELTEDGEDIDAIQLLPDGRLVISTVGTPSLPGVSDPKDEDLHVFDPSDGSWAKYFDASDVDISGGPDINGATVAANGDVYLTPDTLVEVAGITVQDEDILICTPGTLGENTTCDAMTLFFDGSDWGLEINDLDGIHLP